MLGTNRYIDERLELSITSLNPPDSPIDAAEPLTFQEWLKYNNTLYTNANDFLVRYQSYINNWYEIKNNTKINKKDKIKELYTNLINEIVLNFTSTDERRFLKNIDINNNRDLAVAVPFFSQKIKEICLYYSTLRDDVATANLRYNLKGSNLGIEKLIYNEISKSLETGDLTDLIKTLNLDLAKVRDNTTIDVEDLYDTYAGYLDISPNVPVSAYNVSGDREKYFSLNVFEIDKDVFLNFNSTIVDAITSYPFFLIELGTNNFTITPQVDATQLNFLKDSDFINTVNTGAESNLNLNVLKSQIQKFIGTDFYFLSTGSTKTNYVSGVLFTAENEFANYLNKRYPSIASIPSVDFTKTSKQIGLFFKPDKIGFCNFNNFGQTFKTNLNKLSANNIYIFPNPYKFGNITGFTKETFHTPLDFFEYNYLNKIDFSNQYRFGDPDTSSYYQIFRGYQSRDQSLNTSVQGVTRYTDPQDFFNGEFKSFWANRDVFSYESNIFPIDNRIDKLLSINKTVVQYKNDIYGNEFSLYKDVHPEKIPVNERPKQENVIFIYCKSIDGHLFKDPVSGFNFDYSEENAEKGFSGIILKTVDNIPPGTGFYTQGPDYLTPSPLSASQYTEGIPYFAITGAEVPLQSYRFQPETYCPDRVEIKFVCGSRDGVTFTSPGSAGPRLLPDFPSDLPGFSEFSNVYYAELLDGGATPLEEDYVPNIINPGIFTFEPPVSALVDIDGSVFLANSAQPCGTDLEFVVRYVEESNYLDYRIPLRKTTVINGVTGLSTKKSLYETKYVDYGDLYYRNSNSSIILPVSAALSGMFVKYDNKIVNEIYNNLINFDVYYDTIQFETENYILFDKIKFDYKTNIINNTTKNDTFVKRGENKELEKISTAWYSEIDNVVFFCKTVLYPTLSSTNFKAIYPEIYSFNVGTVELLKLFPTIKSKNLTFNDVKMFSLSGTGLDFNIVEIDKPLFSYDDETQLYCITYLGKDLSNIFYIFKIFFKYVNGIITNIFNTMFKMQTNTETLNLLTTSSQLSNYSTFFQLNSSAGNILNGAFILGS
jgi:hypothetical protein